MATSKSKDPRVLDVNPRIGTCVGSATAAELPVVLELAASTGMVACIIGLPGVGKTAHINAWSEKRGSGKPVCVVASQMDPTDVTGLPFPSERNEYTNYLPPVWQQRVCDGNPHVLFFDEFSNTTRTVQAALLKVIGERRFANGAKIPDNVAVICAMKPESCAADYVPLAAPMANRLMFVSYKPTVKEVCAGMTGGWYSEEEYASFTEEERTWRKRVARFLTDNPQYMLDMNDEFASNVTDSAAAAYLDPESEKDESEREIMVYAWASPRSWENACKVLGRLPIDPKELTPLQSRIVSGIVGRKATLAFQKYVKEHGMLDTRAIIADPDSVSWIPNDEMTLNDIYELASAIASASIGEYTIRTSAPRARYLRRLSPLREPGTRSKSPLLAMITPGMPLMRKSSSTAPAGVTQTGQPGPEISRIFCGSRDFRPALAMAMVWVPQISMSCTCPRSSAMVRIFRRISPGSRLLMENSLQEVKALQSLLLRHPFNGEARMDHHIVPHRKVRYKIHPHPLGQAARFPDCRFSLNFCYFQRNC